jgi:hypothetical protein
MSYIKFTVVLFFLLKSDYSLSQRASMNDVYGDGASHSADIGFLGYGFIVISVIIIGYFLLNNSEFRKTIILWGMVFFGSVLIGKEFGATAGIITLFVLGLPAYYFFTNDKLHTDTKKTTWNEISNNNQINLKINNSAHLDINKKIKSSEEEQRIYEEWYYGESQKGNVSKRVRDWYFSENGIGDKYRPEIFIPTGSYEKLSDPESGYLIDNMYCGIDVPKFIRDKDVEKPVIEGSTAISTCPSCGQKCRVQLLKHILITCPKCRRHWHQRF